MKLCDFYEGTCRMKECAKDASLFAQTYDVIVAGMGVAGVVAALTAARCGLKVLGIEQLSVMGGTGTAGGIWDYYVGNPGGIYTDIDNRGQELFRQDCTPEGNSPHKRYGRLSGLYKAEASRQVCEEAGVVTLFDTVVTGVYRDGNRVVGVRVCDGETRSYGCGYVIDCTADGSVCMAAGCDFYLGRESDQSFQPYTNVLISYRNGQIHYANTDSGLLNQYDPFAYGHACLYSATAPLFLPEKFTDEIRFLRLAPLLGIREGRTICGEETVTLEKMLDAVENGEPESTAFYAMSHLDTHSADDYAYGNTIFREFYCLAGMWNQNFTFAIPTGAMIPKGFDGILAAGRMVSVDHAVAQAMRMMIDMHKSGEAAAWLAVQALQNHCGAKDISAAAIRDCLKETGCYREGEKPGIWQMPDKEYSKDIGAYKEAFMTDGDGRGRYILSARYMPTSFGDTLAEWCQSDTVMLRHNAALALAIRHDCRAVPVLLEMMKDRSGHTPAGYYVPSHALSAVTACGILGVTEAIPELFAMLEPGYSEGIPFVKGGYVQTTPFDLAYQYFIYAHRSLLAIAEQQEAYRKEIIDRLDAILYAGDFCLDYPDTLPCNSRTVIILRVHEWVKASLQG